MKKPKTPPVGITLNRRLFNTLVWTLTQFTGSEKLIGENHFCYNADKLKHKILKYSRGYTKENREFVAIYFFENEAAVLIEILIALFSFSRKSVPDYYDVVSRRGVGIPTVME